MKGLVYTQYGQNTRSLCSHWMGWPQYLDKNNQYIFPHSVIFTVRMGSGLYLFGARRLAVSKTYAAVIRSIRKISEMLPSLSPIILYHHILPLSKLQKKSASAFQTLCQPGYNENIFICVRL